MKYADLHLHSTASDGTWTPREVVEAARQKGFSCIALTDHDTVNGVEEAVQAGAEHGIEVIPALEFSTVYNNREVHILGYCIDRTNKELLSELETVADARLNRGRKMVEKLQNLGYDVTWEEVSSIAGEGAVGRPHVARALVNKGYINNIGEAFTTEFIGNGGKAYVNRYKMTPETAVKLTRNAGGVPVLAHPGLIHKGSYLDRDDVIYMVEKGMQGVEVWHTEHPPEFSSYYENIARELDLLLTGGSDCHGGNKKEVLIGKIKLPYEYVDKLLAAAQAGSY
ncbi:MAG: PHP domain-containing protein [Clostridiales bacterium]|nr:PHP domain-containing protein [Clostridiales bacterium]MCF8023509.1 PHP domain-containing protein [Clostridiales bacterium]